MDAYFQRINDTIKLEALPSRLRFMLMVSLTERGSTLIQLIASRILWISEERAGKPQVRLEKALLRLRKFMLKYVAL